MNAQRRVQSHRPLALAKGQAARARRTRLACPARTPDENLRTDHESSTATQFFVPRQFDGMLPAQESRQSRRITEDRLWRIA